MNFHDRCAKKTSLVTPLRAGLPLYLERLSIALDGVSNTAPILGSFTSLFIPDILQANTIKLNFYASEYANSLGANISGYITSNLAPSEITNIQNYILNTTNALYTQRIQDWTFYQNSTQISKDVAFIQNFNYMGGTMSYLINNVIGTPSLLTKLSSS